MTRGSNKWSLILGFQAVACMLGSAFASSSDMPSTVRIASPDHPRVWYLDGNFRKLSQSLRWDQKNRILYLDLTYSLNGEWAHMEDSDLYQTLSVSFPDVQVDRPGRQLYFRAKNGRKIFLGKLTNSFFGDRISPYDYVEISAHRRKGVLDAALVVKDE